MQKIIKGLLAKRWQLNYPSRQPDISTNSVTMYIISSSLNECKG